MKEEVKTLLKKSRISLKGVKNLEQNILTHGNFNNYEHKCVRQFFQNAERFLVKIRHKKVKPMTLSSFVKKTVKERNLKNN